MTILRACTDADEVVDGVRAAMKQRGVMSKASNVTGSVIRSAPRRKRKRALWLRVLAWVIGSIVVLIVLLVAVIALFDWNSLKPTINERASAALERPFAINGDLSVHWRRFDDLAGWRGWIPTPVIRANNIAVGNPEWVGDPSVDGFASLDQAEVAVHLLPLLGRRLSLPYVKLTAPSATLLRRDAEHAT